METETIESFYKKLFKEIPKNINTDIGHFNVFKFEDLLGCSVMPIPYNRREYYKISLIKGENKVHFSDKTKVINKQAILFAKPNIPYNWEQIGEKQSGYSCVFTSSFFHHFGNLKNYSVFQSEGLPIIELTNSQLNTMETIFEKMLVELNGEYVHKYDLMRNLVFEILHISIKIMPDSKENNNKINASQRITLQFLEILEQQFSQENRNQHLGLQNPKDFALEMFITVNHLNKALQETLNKPTSKIINERILLEAKILLKHADWSISEIAFSLGFKETTHFSNFFKKEMNISPIQFRNN